MNNWKKDTRQGRECVIRLSDTNPMVYHVLSLPDQTESIIVEDAKYLPRFSEMVDAPEELQQKYDEKWLRYGKDSGRKSEYQKRLAERAALKS